MAYVIGIVGGLLGGLFGSGSGLILLPAMMHFLKLDAYQARGTTLMVVLGIVISSSFFYYRNDYFNWSYGIYAAIGGVVGGFLGAKRTKRISPYWLTISFEAFVIVVALLMIFRG